MRTARTVAHANIALSKYWGKADAANNLPAVSSLSLTLDGLRTTTTVSFDASLDSDQVILNGAAIGGRPLERVIDLLDHVRGKAGIREKARVESENNFPTAAGLASSSSGFAALSFAAVQAAGLNLTRRQISAIARRSSASAARSLWGGYVALHARSEYAEPIAPAEHLPLIMLVVVTAQGAKKTSSTEGMKHTQDTSPYYSAWVEACAPQMFEEIRRAILERDIERVGLAAEHSAMAMHASMLAACPPLRYFAPATLAVLDRVLEIRASGLLAFATMDAGPNVKVITSPEHVDRVENALRELPMASVVIRCSAGPDAQALEVN